MRAIVDELVTLLGLEEDPKAKGVATGFERLLGGLVKGAAALVAALVTASSALRAYALTQLGVIDESAEFAETIGLTYERFQELAFAIKMNGGSQEDLQTDLLRLAAVMKGPVDQSLTKLAKQMQGLSKSQQVELAKKFRLSPATLRLLQGGADGIQNLARQSRELGLIVSSETAHAAAEFNDQLDILHAVVGALGSRIAVSLLPGLRSLVDAVLAWVTANAKLIQSGIGQVVEGVGRGFDMAGDAVKWLFDQIKPLLPEIDGLSEGLDLTGTIAVAVAGALLLVGLAVGAWAAPFVASAAAVAALLLVLEDLYNFVSGDGESLIGDWAKQFQETFPELSALVKDVASAIGNVLELLGPLALGALKLFGSVFVSVIETIAGAVRLLFGALEGVAGIVRGVGGFIGRFAGAVATSGFNIAPAQSNVPATTVGRSGGGGSVNSGNTFYINGAGDPSAVGADVANRAGFGATTQQLVPGAFGPSVG